MPLKKLRIYGFQQLGPNRSRTRSTKEQPPIFHPIHIYHRLFPFGNHHFITTRTMTFLTTILSTLSPLANLAPYHLLTYGTLLGTSLYQTFIITKVSYNALPISAFTTLQKRIFPVYFKTQSLLLVLTALTVPPYGLVSLFRSKADWIPLVAASSFAMLNLFLCGPRTRKMMIERIHQGMFLPPPIFMKWVLMRDRNEGGNEIQCRKYQ